MNTQTNVATTQKQAGVLEFVPFGAKDAIKLSIAIVKQFVAVKTKSGKTCDDTQAMRFCLLCQAQRLNPFAGDAYLIGYDGKDGPQFSLITAHQAFLKRAEVCEDYDGMESGVMLREKGENGTGKISEIEGDFFDWNAFDLIGGWATVYHKKRKVPTKRKLALRNYAKEYGVWKDNPSGMIVKCAEADALRSTFPTMLGGLYLQDEMPTPTIDVSTVSTSNLVQTSSASEPTPGEASPPQQIASAKEREAVDELCDFVLKDCASTFDAFQIWCVESGNDEQAGSYAGFPDVPVSLAKRLLRAKSGLKAGLAALAL